MKSLYSSMLIFAIVLIVGKVESQSLNHSLLLSDVDNIATAKALSLSGATSTIGADFNGIVQNPASLGVYRHTDFMFSTGFISNSTSTNYNGGERLVSEESKMVLSNIGVVFNTTPKSSSWKTFNVSIGMNKVGSFYSELQYQENNLGSIVDVYFDNFTKKHGENLDAYNEGLAFNANAIYSDGNIFTTDFVNYPDAIIEKSETFSVYGKRNDINFSLASNYEDKIFIGFSLGIPVIDFEEVKYYNEEDYLNEVEYFDNLTLEERYESSGFGVNASLGLIVKATKKIKVGLALHSPSYLSLSDNFSTNFDYEYTDAEGTFVGSDEVHGNFNYKFKTPGRLVGGVSYFIGKKGFVNVDVEWVDYGSIRYDYTGKSNGNEYQKDENTINSIVTNNYKSAMKLRLGGEFSHQTFKARIGTFVNQSPYINQDELRYGWSFGFGIQEKHFFANFGYRNTSFKSGYNAQVFSKLENSILDVENSRNQLRLTMGFKF